MSNLTNKISQVSHWFIAMLDVPNPNALHDYVSGCAGEGEKITPEMVGKIPRDFMYPTIYALQLPSGNKVALYSMDEETGDLCVDYIS